MILKSGPFTMLAKKCQQRISRCVRLFSGFMVISHKIYLSWDQSSSLQKRLKKNSEERDCTTARKRERSEWDTEAFHFLG